MKKIADKLPAGSAFREIILREPDEVSVSDFISKVPVYDQLASLADKTNEKN